MHTPPARGGNGAHQDAHVLAVDDDPVTCRLLEFLLGSQGYDVTTLTDPREALQRIQEKPADLLLLDVQLPRVDGLTLMRQLKREHPDLPVVMLTARGDVPDKLAGLEGGADDYIVKPFEPTELVARVKAVLRRSRRRTNASESAVLTVGGLRLDVSDHLVTTLDGREVALTPTETRILYRLMSSPNRAVSREDLIDYAMEYATETSGSPVNVFIYRLRRKLGDDPRSPHFIASVRGGGYKFLAHGAS